MSEENLEFRALLKKKIGNELSFEEFKTRQELKVLMSSKKNFNMQVGSMYRIVVGQDDKNNMWLNERILLELVTKEDLGIPETKKELEIEKPKSVSEFSQFHTDKRTALLSAIDFHKGKSKTYTEEQVKGTYLKFLHMLLTTGVKKDGEE